MREANAQISLENAYRNASQNSSGIEPSLPKLGSLLCGFFHIKHSQQTLPKRHTIQIQLYKHRGGTHANHPNVSVSTSRPRVHLARGLPLGLRGWQRSFRSRILPGTQACKLTRNESFFPVSSLCNRICFLLVHSASQYLIRCLSIAEPIRSFKLRYMSAHDSSVDFL